MVRGDSTVKIYRRHGKKRYLEGKHIYEHEHIYVPIPSKLHDKIKPFLNHRLNIGIASKNGDLVITLHPIKTFRHIWPVYRLDHFNFEQTLPLIPLNSHVLRLTYLEHFRGSYKSHILPGRHRK